MGENYDLISRPPPEEVHCQFCSKVGFPQLVLLANRGQCLQLSGSTVSVLVYTRVLPSWAWLYKITQA